MSNFLVRLAGVTSGNSSSVRAAPQERHCQIMEIVKTRPLGYVGVYLPLCKVTDTPFHIHGQMAGIL